MKLAGWSIVSDLGVARPVTARQLQVFRDHWGSTGQVQRQAASVLARHCPIPRRKGAVRRKNTILEQDKELPVQDCIRCSRCNRMRGRIVPGRHEMRSNCSNMIDKSGQLT